MKVSNISFVSNVYVMRDVSKLTDKIFMSHVIDPNALNEIVNALHSNALLSPLQKEIRDNAKPCALAKSVNGFKDYTHGVILKDGQYLSVNTCDNEECPHFLKCSTAPNYLKIIRNETLTPIDDFYEEKVSDINFTLDFNESPSASKVRKLKINKLAGTRLQKEIDTIIRSADEKTWGVRGFWRHLADGSVTWVRPHQRHHDDIETISGKERYVRKIIKYRFADDDQFFRFKELFKNRKNNIETISNALSDENGGYQLKNTIAIENAASIVKSSLSSKILVNAGPGTGKTHTVIERLKYIVSDMSDSVDPESVLILCFSRSAVKVIRERLDQAMSLGEISYLAKNFAISTFDSFVTSVIMQIEPNCDLSWLSYDARIERFVKKIKDYISILNDSVTYLIVDEIQDLVGVRARLVKALLENLSCGFLLLGDECQAIYDYQISSPDEFNTSKLYEWLEEYFGEGLIEYELTRNWRNPGKIGDSLKPLRSAMLGLPFQSQKRELNDILSVYGISDMGVEEMLQCCNDGSNETRAILSWSNGDAYRQSQELYTRSDIDISHTILSGSRRVVYRRELADTLHDYYLPRISRNSFFKRCVDREIDKQLAEKLWQGMHYVLDSDEYDSDIDISELKRALLLEKRVCEDLTMQEEFDVTISTIHKAKGKEYDMVILNRNGEITKSEDIKVHYVALTRAKKDLVVKSRNNYALDIKTESGRYVELGRGYDSKIKRVELGIDGDIDPIGFIDKNLPGISVESRQEYIATSIHVGDSIKISKYHGEYLINHGGYIIGRMNSCAFESFRRYYPNGRYHIYSFENYTDFDELYVQSIVSIVNKRLDERIDDNYSKSGFWYGIEFCGYAKPREE